jgi:hypothetical protein
MKSQTEAMWWLTFSFFSLHLLQGHLVLAAESSSDKVIPITSVVTPVKESDGQLNWEEVVQAYLSGNQLFDAKFRRPTGPTYAVAVDCSRSRELGAIIEFKTKTRDVNDVRPLRFSWTHTDADDGVQGFTEFRGAWFMPRVNDILIFSGYLPLKDERRRNGTWMLRMYHLGEQVYREEFQLEFCEKIYAPIWYQD